MRPSIYLSVVYLSVHPSVQSFVFPKPIHSTYMSVYLQLHAFHASHNHSSLTILSTKILVIPSSPSPPPHRRPCHQLPTSSLPQSHCSPASLKPFPQTGSEYNYTHHIQSHNVTKCPSVTHHFSWLIVETVTTPFI